MTAIVLIAASLAGEASIFGGGAAHAPVIVVATAIFTGPGEEIEERFVAFKRKRVTWEVSGQVTVEEGVQKLAGNGTTVTWLESTGVPLKVICVEERRLSPIK